MPKEIVKIEFSEQDIKELIAEKYNLSLDTVSIDIYHYEAGNDPREHDYTTITIEGKKNDRLFKG